MMAKKNNLESEHPNANSPTDIVRLIFPNKKVSDVELLHGGGNNRVYRVDFANGEVLALKLYFAVKGKENERCNREYAGLSFLWQYKLRNIPKPLLCDVKQNVAVYSFINGKPVPSKTVSQTNINQLTNMLTSLHKCSKKTGSLKLGNAAESCFTFTSLTANILSRYRRLLAESHDKKVHEFLVKEFNPAYKIIKTQSKRILEEAQINYIETLPIKFRTLSPSDFGFHNSLRSSAGKLFFLDFEYFGWDDPVKMISDFLLHPKNIIGIALKQKFMNIMIAEFNSDKKLKIRLRAYFPLFALKWCMILLNEFIKIDFARREFAKGPLDQTEIQKIQLTKAKNMLLIAKNSINRFPYAI
jgi:thiamine kinase-like enzyme